MATARTRTRTRKPRPIGPFLFHNGWNLRRAGLKGRWVTAMLMEDGLSLSGDKAGTLLIPFDAITGILAGKRRHRVGSSFALRIASTAAPTVKLGAMEGGSHAGYDPLVRALAAALDERGRLDRVRMGLPRASVFGIPLLVVACALFMILIGMVSEDGRAVLKRTSTGELWLGGALIVAIILVTAGWDLPQGFHRRVRQPADLDRVLGPPAG